MKEADIKTKYICDDCISKVGSKFLKSIHICLRRKTEESKRYVCTSCSRYDRNPSNRREWIRYVFGYVVYILRCQIYRVRCFFNTLMFRMFNAKIPSVIKRGDIIEYADNVSLNETCSTDNKNQTAKIHINDIWVEYDFNANAFVIMADYSYVHDGKIDGGRTITALNNEFSGFSTSKNGRILSVNGKPSYNIRYSHGMKFAIH